MFEQLFYECPYCNTEIRQDLKDDESFACTVCGKNFKVMRDGESGNVGLIEIGAKEMPEPLFLPKGSIRSLITVVMAASCWIFIFSGKDVPNYLFSLILTIVGYYFGFRKKVVSARSRILSADGRTEEPLFLPHGVVRYFLLAGFIVSGIVIYTAGTLTELKYLEFFVIISGLIAGYMFARVFSKFERSPA